MQRIPGTLSWPKGMRGTSAVVCVGAPLRSRVTHEITHLDGRAVAGAPPRVACVVYIAGAAGASTFCVQRNPTMSLGVLEARMWSVSVLVVGVGVPLRARITVLEMVHLDGRVR